MRTSTPRGRLSKNDVEPQPVAVELHDGREVIGRPRDPQVRAAQVDGIVHREPSVKPPWNASASHWNRRTDVSRPGARQRLRCGCTLCAKGDARYPLITNQEAEP